MKVYIAGDYLDIMALKIAAIRNLDERASVPSPPAGFTAAVRETLINTPHNDPELRTRVFSMYLENIEMVEDETEKGASTPFSTPTSHSHGNSCSGRTLT